MSKKITFSAQKREVMGKKTKHLRKSGLVPANVSGYVDHPITIQVEKSAFTKLYREVGETGLVYLQIEGENKDRPTLIGNLDFDTITDEVLHVVFKQVNLSEKIEASVPVVLEGENSVPNTAIVKAFDAITVEALPTDLPESFTFDISQLTEIGQTLTFADLKYDQEKVELKLSEEELQSPIVILQEQKEVAEETLEVAAEGAEGTDAAPTADAASAEGQTEAEAAATPAGE